MFGETGELTETRGEVRVEWRIEIPSKEARYTSPVFPLSDSCWCLEISFYDKSSVDVYLERRDYGPPKTLSFAIGFKKADDGEEIVIRKEGFTFAKDSEENKRFVLKNAGSIQYSHGIMVVTCSLQSDEQHCAEVCLFKRLWTTSITLNDILRKGKKSDVVLKVKNEKIAAHRLILDARCPDFLGKVECDVTEEAEACSDKGTLSNVVPYLYSGVLDELSTRNVRSVYQFAHHYQLQELKKLCAAFMEKDMTVNGVCDIILLADSHDDAGLKERAKEFLAKKAYAIVDTCTWREFKRQNSDLCVEILEHMMKKEAV